MTKTPLAARSCEELRNQELLREVNALRKTDNLRNWLYLVKEYTYLAAVLAPTLIFFHFFEQWGFPWLCLIPVTAISIVLIGIGQHRLIMMGHEASHYLLFRNPILNESASNWLCMYPMWSMTYNYRLQHLAHHQHTNDPELDPDMIYMNLTGHRFHHPMDRIRFLWECVIKVLLWIPGLVINIFVRAWLANQGGGKGPYKARNKSAAALPILHIGVQIASGLIMLWGILSQQLWLVALPPVIGTVAILVIAIVAPANWYIRTAIRPTIPLRWAVFQRQMFVTLLLTGMAWLTVITGRPWPVFYFLLWLVPLGTVFSFLMILREEVQHSNTPAERFLDSRNYKGNPIVRWAVFPHGQALHLPHHLFPLVPHYNLARLERLLQSVPAYQTNAVDVGGMRHQTDVS